VPWIISIAFTLSMRTFNLIQILHSSERQRLAKAEMGLSLHFGIGYVVSANGIFEHVVGGTNWWLFIHVDVLTAHLGIGQKLTGSLKLWWIKRHLVPHTSVRNSPHSHHFVHSECVRFPRNLCFKLQIDNICIKLSNSMRLRRFSFEFISALALNLNSFIFFTILRRLSLINDFIYF